MTDGATMSRVPDSEWTPDAWVMTISRSLQFMLLWIGMGVLFAGCFASVGIAGGLFLGLALSFASVLLHEVGHAAAAVLSGATVMRARVGSVELQPLRDGVRARWKRGQREFAGLVSCIPSPRAPLRRQMLVYIAAGPAINAALAIGALAWGHALLPERFGATLLFFGVFNAAIAAANLLPWTTRSMLASDGLQLLRWLRGIGNDDPQVALLMFNARLVSGERFGDWADDYLRVMARSSQPGPLVVLWTRMKLAQAQGDWARVDEVMREVELNIVGLSPQVAKALEGFIAILRCEAAFSRAMAGQTLERSPVDILGADMGWLLPAVRLRCEALECVLQGEFDAARMRLAESERWSNRSVDRSQEAGEMVLREAIVARMDRARDAVTQQEPRIALAQA